MKQFFRELPEIWWKKIMKNKKTKKLSKLTNYEKQWTNFLVVFYDVWVLNPWTGVDLVRPSPQIAWNLIKKNKIFFLFSLQKFSPKINHEFFQIFSFIIASPIARSVRVTELSLKNVYSGLSVEKTINSYFFNSCTITLENTAT